MVAAPVSEANAKVNAIATSQLDPLVLLLQRFAQHTEEEKRGQVSFLDASSFSGVVLGRPSGRSSDSN